MAVDLEIANEDGSGTAKSKKPFILARCILYIVTLVQGVRQRPLLNEQANEDQTSTSQVGLFL